MNRHISVAISIRHMCSSATKKSGRSTSIWDEHEKVGTVAAEAFLPGLVPNRMRTGIKAYSRKFIGAISRTKINARRAASS